MWYGMLIWVLIKIVFLVSLIVFVEVVIFLVWVCLIKVSEIVVNKEFSFFILMVF